MPPPFKNRVKTKTFNGCWTCRLRKVKCDGARPTCQQCKRRDIECEGYTARLQWLTPETGPKAPLPMTYNSTGMSQRRQMFCDEPAKILTDQELDSYLDQIESRVPQAESSIDTISRGPFAVFPREKKTHGPCSAAEGGGRDLDDLDRPAAAAAAAADSGPEAPVNEVVERPEEALTDYLSPDSSGPVDVSWSDISTAAPTGSDNGTDLLACWSSGWYGEGASPGALASRTTHPSHAPPDGMSEGLLALPWQISPFQVSAELKHLLHHYVNHVVDVMTVVATPKGPWKSVHLPRALQASGELAFLGKTSHACNALLHALLTISAYNLSATYSIADQELEAQKWRCVALMYRARSLTHLNACLQAGGPVSERGKYKEVLAAMLSMITIDVFSGDTHFCEWHLKGVEGFIRASCKARRRNNNRYSGKAQALHRVYVYLRVMRESTDLRCQVLDEGLRSSPESLSTWLARPLCFLEGMKAPRQWLQDRPGSHGVLDMSACEFVYGIPMQLLVLVSKTSELIRRKRTFLRHFPNTVLPRPFSTMCDHLELEILEWPVERMVEDIRGLPIAHESRKLITHQTRAFHQATIIYFSRLVRSIHRRHLQPYVEKVMDNLEAVERIKHGANLATGCVSWPGFVAAAEALDSEVQSRYLQWLRSIQFYGLGSYDRAREVVLEVWEMERIGKGLAPDCDWPAVIDLKDVRLMLT